MKRSLTYLIFVALLCGVLWRAELELRWGWASLTWAWKLYAAFPLSMASFAAWVVLITRVRERTKFAAAQMAFFILALVFFWCYLRYAVAALMGPFPAFNFLVVWMLPVFWVFLPLSFGSKLIGSFEGFLGWQRHRWNREGSDERKDEGFHSCKC